MFSFNTFVALGGISDVFVDRGYGPNFSDHESSDRQFVDVIEALNEGLLVLGLIKPTIMFADMSKKRVQQPRVYKTLTPEFCVRAPAPL
jgi:hypothetical protein